MITENACCITKGWKYFKHWPAQGCLLSSCHRCTALSIEPVASKRLRGAKAQAVTYLQKWKLTWHWMDFFYLLIVRYLSYWIHTWYAETKYEGYCQYSVKKKEHLWLYFKNETHSLICAHTFKRKEYYFFFEYDRSHLQSRHMTLPKPMGSKVRYASWLSYVRLSIQPTGRRLPFTVIIVEISAELIVPVLADCSCG